MILDCKFGDRQANTGQGGNTSRLAQHLIWEITKKCLSILDNFSDCSKCQKKVKVSRKELLDLCNNSCRLFEAHDE